MRMDENEENYWELSNVKSNRQKVNIFDDKVTVEAAALLAKFNKNQSDANEKDTIDNLSTEGIMVKSISTSNPRLLSDTSRPPKHASGTTSTLDYGMVIENCRSVNTVTGTSKVASEPNLASDVYGTDSKCRVTSLNKQDKELEFVKLKLQQAQNALGAVKLKVEDTVSRILTGQPFSLEQYKSKDEKLELLDTAVQTHDGNAIMAAVVFLKKTLTHQIFCDELVSRPIALDQYLAYQKTHNMKEFEDMMCGLPNRSDDMAMYRYKQALKAGDSMSKIHELETCLRSHFKDNLGLELDAQLIKQQINLLYRQIPLDIADDMIEKQGKNLLFTSMPRVASIVNMPVITTLYYCCIYHYDETEKVPCSPLSLQAEHQLTDKQFAWTAVKARAKLRKWDDIESMFTCKSWLGGTKMKCVIGFDKVVQVMHKYGAPTDILAKFLKLVDVIDRRLEIAEKVHCHEAVIETYQNQRDKRSLEMYTQKLKQNSREWFLAKSVLNDTSIRWKT